MNKKEKKDLKKELAEGVEHLQRQSFIDGAKNAMTALTMSLKNSSNDSFRKDQLLTLIVEISKVFDDKEKSNRFLQPTCEHIEDFLKDEGVEGLDADSQQICIGWEFKLEDIL